MSGTEWDDEDAEYPRAPVPPHERTWRHPSELGATWTAPPVPSSSLSRTAVAGIGVVGVAVVVGLIQLLLPRAGTSVNAVSTQASTRTTHPAITAEQLVSVVTRTTLAPTTLVLPRTTARPATPRHAAVPPSAREVSTLVLVKANRAAVPVGDGRRAVTIGESLAPTQKVEVQVADGSSVAAVVKSVDPTTNVALLELETPAADGAAPKIASQPPSDGDVVMVGTGGATPAVLHQSADGLVVDTDEPTDDGAPVLDETGALVGLAATDDDGTVHLLPIPGSSTIDSAQLEVDVWLGLRFDATTLVVTEVQAGAPADVAGVAVGDKLAAVDGTPLLTIDDLWDALVGHHPGDVITLTVERADAPVDVSVTLGARPR